MDNKAEASKAANSKAANSKASKAANSKAEASKIFRYKLSDTIMTSITQFAHIHQFDDRHQYKEAWTYWLKDNQDCVEREISRLKQLDYTGDIVDKMFKAGRYYFRGKATIKETKIEKKETKRNYIVMNPDLIQTMDIHLRGLMAQPNFKPALAYTQFCEQHAELVKTEIRRLAETISGEKMLEKLKKTYKNRYFGLQQHC